MTANVHCLLTALGSYGDVHPMIGLGAALQSRGHDVEIIANPYFKEEIERNGLRLTPLGTREQYEQLTQSPDLWHPRRGAKVVLQLATTLGLRTLYQVIQQRYRPGETVIAAHGLDLASRLATEKLRTPVATVTFAPMAIWSRYAPPKLPIAWSSTRVPSWLNQLVFQLGERFVLRRQVGPAVAAMRQELGLPRIGCLLPDWWYGTGKMLCLFPDWYAPPQRDWPQGTVCTGFPLWDGAATRSLSDDCQRFLDSGERPIVFTPGSANRQATGFFRVAVAACERLGRRAMLLSKYPEQLPRQLPSGAGWFAFEPLTKVLPDAAAFVHHGGIGSSSQALAAGTPQLIRPLGFDQHDNASRLIDLGVAEQLSPQRFTEKNVTAALDRLLTSEETKSACRELAGRCNGPTALGKACAELEAFAASRL